MNVTKLFFISVIVLFVFTNCQNRVISDGKSTVEPEIENNLIVVEQTKIETSEEKAVRLAEEFIKINGYTEMPADKNNLSYESIEYYKNIDELLEQRKNTLKPKAYSLSSDSKNSKNGWTIAFLYNKNRRKNYFKNKNTTGRAVTMNENFENLRVEHVDVFLNKLEKKLQ